MTIAPTVTLDIQPVGTTPIPAIVQVRIGL